MSGPYSVKTVTETVSFGFGSGQKSEIKRFLLVIHDRPVRVVNATLGAVNLMFDDEAVAQDFAHALNSAGKAKK